MKKTTKAIDNIQKRNARVEADKAWETSVTRRTAIVVLTYAVVAIFLIIIRADKPWLTALIPTAGFVLSTLILSPIKNWWIKNIHRK